MADLSFIFGQNKYLQLDALQSRAADMNAENIGISSMQLMENASNASAKSILKIAKGRENILIICGKGNNGGDGLGIARHLKCLNLGLKIAVCMMYGINEIKTKEALSNLRAIKNMQDIKISWYDPDVLSDMIKESDLIVDCMLGTGSSGRPKSPISQAISEINASKKLVVSIDVPSGLDTSTGIDKYSIKADYTLTFHRNKSFLNGSKFAGEIEVLNIGIPIAAHVVAGPGDIYIASRHREIESNKSTNGRVLVIGGSHIFHGAPALSYSASYAMLAALRVGSGYVSAYVPKSAQQANRSVSTNVIVRSFIENELSGADMPEIKESINHSDAVVLGPGLGGSFNSIDAAKEIVRYCIVKNKNIVVDADAIGSIDGKLAMNVLITPNISEFKKLLNSKLELNGNILLASKSAMRFAKSHNVNVLLKAHISILTDGDRIKIISPKSASLASMGTGDVLAGIIAAYAAIGNAPFEAAAAGAYVHSRIGDLLYEIKGNHLVASDIINMIPEVTKPFD